jgi:L-asparaginase
VKPSNSYKKLVVLGMGGTIAGTANSAADNVGYRAAQVKIDDLLHSIPALGGVLRGYELVTEQVAQVDSKDLEFSHWIALAKRVNDFLAMSDVAGIVVTHGTDTLEETAFFLSQVLPAEVLKTKAVVLTCAMRPASSMSPDGPQNVMDAVAVALSPGAKDVVVVCAGVVHSAVGVQKVHTYRLDAFDSGEAGPLGYVEEGVLRMVNEGLGSGLGSEPMLISNLSQVAWPRVEIVMNYVGVTGAVVRAMCARNALDDDPVMGIVVAGTGNGTIHVDLDSALREAHAQGVRIVRTTRCAKGCVVPGALNDGAFPHSGGLSPVKARIALMLDLLAQKKAA